MSNISCFSEAAVAKLTTILTRSAHLSVLFPDLKATLHPIYPIFTIFLVKFLLIPMNIIVESYDNLHVQYCVLICLCFRQIPTSVFWSVMG